MKSAESKRSSHVSPTSATLLALENPFNGKKEGEKEIQMMNLCLKKTFPLKKRSISRAHRVIETSKTNDKTME